ncbi:late embryogenesis abundant protein D-113-like [Hibiscus syriacus]|uniref:late embryogenesis abundant protein D-113-like n=1 Tax=Hibiscus syriacus TaxID=106335 RepID=UPI001921793D|nr:late embryogenesis abundant protein D-113-like [Hibiscus syriacus]
MKANGPIEKDMARERKEDAELRKQEAHHHNATGGRAGGTGFTTGGYNRAETGIYGGGGVHDVNSGGGGGTGLTTGGDTNISGEPTNAGSRRNTRGTQEDRFY